MADDSDGGSSATEEEDEPPALEDHISQWVLDDYQAGHMEMSRSLLKHQVNSRFRCQQAEGNECCDAKVGCQKAEHVDDRCMQIYNEKLLKFNGADARRLPAAGAGEMVKRRKVAPPAKPVPQNRVFDDIFCRDLAGKIVSFHVETSMSLCDVLHRSLKQIGEESTDAILPKSQIFAESHNGEFAMSDGDPISLKFPAQSMVDGQTEQYVNKFWVGQQSWYEFRFKQDKVGVKRQAVVGVNPNVSPRREIGSKTNPLHMRGDEHNQKIFLCACMRAAAEAEYADIGAVVLRWVLPARVVRVKNPDVAAGGWLVTADVMVHATAQKPDVFAPLEIDLPVFGLGASISATVHTEIKAQWQKCLDDKNNENWGKTSHCSKWFRVKLCQISPRFLALVKAQTSTRLSQAVDALRCGRPANDTYMQRFGETDRRVLGARQFDSSAARRMHDLFVVLQGHQVLERLPRVILQAIMDNLAIWLGGKIHSKVRLGDCGTLAAACYEYVTASKLNVQVFKRITPRMKSFVETDGVAVKKKKASTLVKNAQPIDVEDGRNICFQGATQDELLAECVARGISVDALQSALATQTSAPPSPAAKQRQTASHRAREPT